MILRRTTQKSSLYFPLKFWYTLSLAPLNEIVWLVGDSQSAIEYKIYFFFRGQLERDNFSSSKVSKEFFGTKFFHRILSKSSARLCLPLQLCVCENL